MVVIKQSDLRDDNGRTRFVSIFTDIIHYGI